MKSELAGAKENAAKLEKVTAELEALTLQNSQLEQQIKALKESSGSTPQSLLFDVSGDPETKTSTKTTKKSKKTKSSKKKAVKKQSTAKAPVKKKSAKKTATKKSATKKTAKKDKPDDLRKIEGVGPKIASVLKDSGIKTFRELGKCSQKKLREILEQAGPRMKGRDTSTWPKQAKLAAQGKWDELKILQDELIGGREA